MRGREFCHGASAHAPVRRRTCSRSHSPYVCRRCVTLQGPKHDQSTAAALEDICRACRGLCSGAFGPTVQPRAADPGNGRSARRPVNGHLSLVRQCGGPGQGSQCASRSPPRRMLHPLHGSGIGCDRERDSRFSTGLCIVAFIAADATDRTSRARTVRAFTDQSARTSALRLNRFAAPNGRSLPE